MNAFDQVRRHSVLPVAVATAAITPLYRPDVSLTLAVAKSRPWPTLASPRLLVLPSFVCQTMAPVARSRAV